MTKQQILILVLILLIAFLGYLGIKRELDKKNPEDLNLVKEEIIQKSVVEEKKIENKCNPNWICDDWSMGKYGDCSEEGERTRECRDLNNCNTEDLKPDTVMQCEAVKYNPPKLGPFEIEIIGDQYCKDKVNEALAFMKDNSPKFYTKVITYIGVIECTDKKKSSQLSEEIPRTLLADMKFFRTVTQLAGTLIHEAHHSELYTQYRVTNKVNEVPFEIYSGRKAEEECVDETIKFLKEVNAPADEIYYEENKFEIEGEWWNRSE